MKSFADITNCVWIPSKAMRRCESDGKMRLTWKPGGIVTPSKIGNGHGQASIRTSWILSGLRVRDVRRHWHSRIHDYLPLYYHGSSPIYNLLPAPTDDWHDQTPSQGYNMLIDGSSEPVGALTRCFPLMLTTRCLLAYRGIFYRRIELRSLKAEAFSAAMERSRIGGQVPQLCN